MIGGDAAEKETHVCWYSLINISYALCDILDSNSQLSIRNAAEDYRDADLKCFDRPREEREEITGTSLKMLFSCNSRLGRKRNVLALWMSPIMLESNKWTDRNRQNLWSKINVHISEETVSSEFKCDIN